MDRKVKITIEMNIEDLLYVINGGSSIAVASEEEGYLTPDSGTEDNNNNNNNSGNKENTGRPGAGVGVTGPERPGADSEGGN